MSDMLPSLPSARAAYRRSQGHLAQGAMPFAGVQAGSPAALTHGGRPRPLEATPQRGPFKVRRKRAVITTKTSSPRLALRKNPGSLVQKGESMTTKSGGCSNGMACPGISFSGGDHGGREGVDPLVEGLRGSLERA